MNQGEENQNIDSEKKYENFLRDGIVVHTMPKGFKRADAEANGRHMSAGIFVMIGGLALLLGLGSLAYYLVVKKDFFSLNKNVDLMLTEEELLIDSVEKKDSVVQLATSSPVIATSTENIADLATSAIDSLIDEFNQDLGTSSLSTSSESMDVFSDSNSSVVDVASSDIASSSEEQISDDQKKEIVIREATDTDTDGLSDIEEALLGSDPIKMDTDGDGYSDFQELDKMYDPIGKGSLSSNKAITSYSNPTHNYSFIYPLAWTASNFDKDDSIIFKIDGLQFVQITVQPNTDNQVIEDWYKKQFGVDVIDESQRVTDKKDWSGVVSKDGLNYFLTKEGVDGIYVLSYNLGISNALNYKKLFEMMVNSLDVAN